jgi:hypothetical protein
MDDHFPRADLARQIADQLSPDPLFGASSGLFLAAPRRTGKSSFLRLDLIPELTARGRLPIYVDLWSDRARDPGALIAEAVARAYDGLASRIETLWRSLPFSRISVGGVSADLPKAASRSEATLAQALVDLGDRAGADIVFIIDEAQHALSSPAGMDAMFALKAARDAMNQRRGKPHLFLLFTGSHRDKLAGLVLTHRQPFFGAAVRDFPKLGRGYVEALVHMVNPRLAPDNQLDPEDAMRAFELLGHRPEKLREIVQEHALGAAGSAGLRQTVAERADLLRARIWQQHRSDYGQLSDLQRAVVRRLIEDGPDFAPFAAPTLQRIGESLQREVGASEVQKALDDLREKSLVWRPQRGLYALEDQDMRDWLLAGDADG